MKRERWRACPRDSRYEVSDLGRVRRATAGKGTRAGRIMVGRTQRSGHVTVTLPDGVEKVHRLVLEAFVGPCPRGLECRHRNDVGADNRLTNLVWGTRRENLLDRRSTGRVWRMPGTSNPSAKLTPKTADQARALALRGMAQDAIARKLRVSQTTISLTIRGLRWTEGE